MANADPRYDQNTEDTGDEVVDVSFNQTNSIGQPGTNVDISNDISDTGTASQDAVVSKLDDLLRNSTDHHREFIERFDNIDMRMQLLEDRIQRQDETLNKLFGVIELLGQEDTGTYFV